MKLVKLSAVALFLSLLTLPTVFDRVAHSQSSRNASTSATTTDTTSSDSPSTAPETTLTEQQSAALEQTTDEANKVSGSDSNAANDPVDPEGVAAGTTDTFSYDPDTDPAAASSTAPAAANSTAASSVDADAVIFACPPIPAPTNAPSCRQCRHRRWLTLGRAHEYAISRA